MTQTQILDITSATGRQLGRQTLIIRTTHGYVGRYNLTDNLCDTMPEQFAACFDSREDAERVAKGF